MGILHIFVNKSGIGLLLKNINFFNGFNKVVPTVISGLLKTVMTIGSIASFIGDMLHNLIDTLLLTATAPLWLVLPVLNGISQLLNLAGSVLSLIGTLFKNGLGNLIKHILTKLVQAVPNWLTNVIKWLLAPITNLINTITKSFSFNTWLQNALKGIFLPLTIANKIGSLVRTISSLINGLTGFLNLIGRTLFGAILNGFKNLISQPFINSLVNDFLSGLAFGIPAVIGMTGLFNTVKNLISKLLTSVINLVMSPIKGIISFIGNQLLGNLLTNLIKFGLGVQNFFKNLPMNLLYVFGLLIPQLLGLLNPLTAGLSLVLLPLTILLGLPKIVASLINGGVNNLLASLIGHLIPTVLTTLGNLISGLFSSPLLPVILPLLQGLNSLLGLLYNVVAAPIKWVTDIVKTLVNGLNNLIKLNPVNSILGLILGGLGIISSLGKMISQVIKPFQDANSFAQFFKNLVSTILNLGLSLGTFGLVGFNNALLDGFKLLTALPTLLVNVINGLMAPLFGNSALTALKLLATPVLMFLVEIPAANLINQLVPSVLKGILGLVVPLITALGFLPTLLLTMAGNQISLVFNTLPTVLRITNALSSLIGNIAGLLTKVFNGIKRFISGLLSLPLNALMIGLASLNPFSLLTLIGSSIVNGLNKLPMTILGWLYDLNTKNLSNAITKFVTPILSTIIGLLAYLGMLPLISLINGIPNFVGSLIGTVIPGILTNLILPQIIGGLTGLILPLVEFLNFINTALQSAFTLPLLFITAPVWIGLPLLSGIGSLVSNLVLPVLNFFNNHVLQPIQSFINSLIANIVGSLLAGVVKLLTYPLAVLNAVTAILPGLLLNKLINDAIQLMNSLNNLSGFISGLVGFIVSPLINVVKSVITGLLTNILKGILNGIDNLTKWIDSITSGIAQLTEQLINWLSQLINNLLNVWKLGITTVGTALLAGLLPEVVVPDWLNKLFDSISTFAQKILNFSTVVLLGYLLIKNAAGSLLDNFLLPLLGGLLGAILGGLLNKIINININININGLPLLLVLLPLMSIFNTLGNGLNLLLQLLGSVLPGLIQLLLGGNKVIVVPIILPIIIPLIIPVVLSALLPILLIALLPLLLIVPIILCGLPVFIGLIELLPVLIGIPLIISIILPLIIPIVGIGGLIGIVSLILGGIVNNGTINLPNISTSPVVPDGTMNVPGLPIGTTNNGGTSQVPSTGNHVGGNSQSPSTPSNNNGHSNKQTGINGNRGNGNGSSPVITQPNTAASTGSTTPTSTMSNPQSMVSGNQVNAQQKLPQTNENTAHQLLIAVLGIILLLLEILGYVWISRRRKFSIN